jgi:hypothetical protein
MSFNPDKTEIMLFKNVENSTNFYFYFDGKLIPLTSDHKHLGITEITEDKEQTFGGPQQTQTHMRTTNLYLLLFGVYNINNFQTIKINSTYIRP